MLALNGDASIERTEQALDRGARLERAPRARRDLRPQHGAELEPRVIALRDQLGLKCPRHLSHSAQTSRMKLGGKE